MTALKAPFHELFKPLIVHARPYAAVRTRPSAGGERQLRSRDSIFPGWNLDGTALHTGSSVCFCSCRAALFPVPCPTAGLRLGNIYRSATGKYSERRHRVPSRCPAAGSFHQRCYSIGVPALEHAGIGGRLNVVSYFAINYPLLIWT